MTRSKILVKNIDRDANCAANSTNKIILKFGDFKTIIKTNLSHPFLSIAHKSKPTQKANTLQTQTFFLCIKGSCRQRSWIFALKTSFTFLLRTSWMMLNGHR